MHVQLPTLFDSEQTLPDVVFGYASATSQGGTSIFNAEPHHFADVSHFYALPDALTSARGALASHGFTIHAESTLGFAINLLYL